MQVTRDEWSLGGIDLTLDDFDRIGSYVPLLVDLHPAGRFLMDDFYRASGLLAAQLNHQASAFGGYVARLSASATATPFSKIENPPSHGSMAPTDRHREQVVRFRASSS